jgi:alpha-mannosidase
MLSDHAWNGNSEANKLHNAELRKKWSEQFALLSSSLQQKAWAALALKPDKQNITVFNSLGFRRKGLVRIEEPAADIGSVSAQGKDVRFQIIEEQGKSVLYFVCPETPGFGFEQVTLKPGAQSTLQTDKLSAAPTQLESPYYRLTVDLTTGGISGLVHKATATELVVPDAGRTICQTRYFDGAEHTLTNVKSEVIAAGPILARLRIDGITEGIEVTSFVTVYAELDQVDFDIHIEKPVTSKQQRLCQVFPVLTKEAELRIETTGAVIRPMPQPQGDLLGGADNRRFAVQGFVDASVPGGIGVTIAPIDAFALRLDLAPITFELLGNDQNYREVTQDQHGVTKFRFRYAVRARAGGYNAPDAFAFSRSAASPLLAVWGAIPENALKAVIELDQARAIATALKPADEESAGGSILRLWEVAGRSEPLGISVKGYRKAVLTDLLERDISDLKIVGDRVTIDLNAHGFSCLRLLP